MRLACPNCGAQYEVPADAVPPGGRDVQCSACGRTWFESGAALAPGPEAAGIGFDEADLDELDRLAEGVPRVEGDDEEDDDLAEIGRPDASWAGAPPERAPRAQAAVSEPEPAWVPRSTVTPEVAEILRSEALREATARERERGEGAPAPAAPSRPLMPPESASLMPVPERRTSGGATEGAAPLRSLQAVVEARRAVPRPAGAGVAAPQGASIPARSVSPVGGDAPRPAASLSPSPPMRAPAATVPAPMAAASALPNPAPNIAHLSNIVLRRAEEARRRMARLRALAEAEARREPVPQPARPTASPLRPAPATPPSRHAREAAEAPRARRPGFLRGFSTALLLAASLAALYATAPRIIAALPASAPALQPFADAVDEGRLWLDLQFQALARSVEGSATSAPSAAPSASPDALPEAIEGASPGPALVAPLGEAPAAPAAPSAERAPTLP